MFILNPSRFSTASSGGGGWSAAINFRATSGYIADGTGETHCIGDLYPTTRDGITFGWDSNTIESRDRANSVDRRLAGMNFIRNGGVNIFYADLPSSGDYLITFAGHDAGFPSAQVFGNIL